MNRAGTACQKTTTRNFKDISTRYGTNLVVSHRDEWEQILLPK
jgi:hypothetical protein